MSVSAHQPTTSLAAVAPSALGPLALDLDAARAFAGESKSARTREAYRCQWRTFARWCETSGVEAIPADPRTVAAYLSARAEDGLKVASLALALSSISAAHRLAGHAAPGAHPVVAEVWAGIRRTLGTAQRRAAPATVEVVRELVAGSDDDLGAKRDRALLLLGFAGAFRRSELVALDVADLSWRVEGLVVRVRRSKTDQEGAGVDVAIAYGGNPATCPVRAVRAWIEAAGIAEGALFRSVDRHERVGGRLAGGDVARVVKRAAARAGLDPAAYSGHSLRAGLATTAARQGRPDRSIMRQGRWASRAMVDRYVRDATLFDGNVTSGIGL